MAAIAEQRGATSAETPAILNPEQMRQIITSSSGGTRRPKQQNRRFTEENDTNYENGEPNSECTTER